jgi:hypothetical protein
MISVVVSLDREDPAVVDTLAALVPGVAEGLLRDVWLAAPAHLAFAEQVADAAGCGLVSDGMDAAARAGAALARCRADWALSVAGGVVPAGLWMQAAEDFLSVVSRRGASAPVGAFLLGDAYGRVGLCLSAAQRLRVSLRRPSSGQPLLGPKDGVTAITAAQRWPMVLLKAVAADRRVSR